MTKLGRFETIEERRAWYRQYRKDNPKWREYNRKYMQEYRKKNPYDKKDWYERNKEKARVHTKVYLAVKSGKIKKGKCRDCKSHKVQAHHTDYTKPFKIIWLCSKHHRQEHVKFSPKDGKYVLHHI